MTGANKPRQIVISACDRCPYAVMSEDNFDPGYDCVYIGIKPLYEYPKIPDWCLLKQINGKD
jgi:hypothetical protein